MVELVEERLYVRKRRLEVYSDAHRFGARQQAMESLDHWLIGNEKHWEMRWERDILVVITGSTDRKTNESLTQSNRFSICTHDLIHIGNSSDISSELPRLSHPVDISL